MNDQSVSCRTEQNGAESQTVTANSWAAPAAQVVGDAEGFTLEVEMPGVNKDGLEITVDGEELTIVGRRTAPASVGKALYRESRGRDYRRVFQLDHTVDVGKITARVESGVVTLWLPKAESVKPRRIEVA